MSCSLWCGSGRCAAQDVPIRIKIPAFAGMTGSAGAATSAGMTEEFRGSDECGDGGAYRSTDGERQFFPGYANPRIGIQAGQDEDRHWDL
jgi:hypothetical protein